MNKAFKVYMRFGATKIVYCEGPNEAAVLANPWNYAAQDHGVDPEGWEVLGIEEVGTP